MSTGEAIKKWRKELDMLQRRWGKTSAKDAQERQQLRRAFGVVYQGLKDCGLGPNGGPVNYVYEKRDPFSIWHMQYQRVEMPPTLNVRQAVELLTNGQCGD